MKTAIIDYEAGAFCVTVREDGRRVDIGWGEYAMVIAFAVQGGVARSRVSLTPEAQSAALQTCFGGAP